jgi:uncharacterized protein (TIGR03435 family)
MFSMPKRASIFILLTLCGSAMPAAWPQENTMQASASARPAFDAASVKVHGNGPGGINLHQAGGHLSIKGFTLQQLMGVAYNLPSLSQAGNTIVGMPNWGIMERFDIDAEAPGNPTIAQKTLMLQSLLADRFGLVVHHETRVLPIYSLVLVNAGKLGPQIHPHPATERCDASASAGYEPWAPQHALVDGTASGTQDSPAALAAAALQHYPCGNTIGGLLSANDRDEVWSGARNVSMETIAAGIGTMEDIDRPVVNETDLSGDFDFTVEWDIRADHLATNPSPTAQSEPLGDSLFEAFRHELGLELKPTKGPVDVIVIDHVEQPKPN